MKNMSNILILLSLAACAQEKARIPTVTAPPDAQPYVQEFTAMSPVPVKDLSVKINDLDDEELAGVCYRETGQQPKIVLNKKHWVDFDSDEREELVFHEMAHCILNKEHDDNGYHIMNSTMLPEGYYQAHRKELIEELFK